MFGITAHMIVKNEDRWVWFALQSILPYVDKIIITDTGSSDKTLKIIESFASPKIQFTKVVIHTSADVTSVRSAQLTETKTPWIWIVDGDEIYPSNTAKECLTAAKSNHYEGVVVRRYDLMGDIYHRQVESVGSYELFGQKGHLLVRLLNRDKINNLIYRGDYPNEGFLDGNGKSILTRKPLDWYITKDYLYHAMYLKRSSQGGNLPMFNRSKYKIETGIRIDAVIPEVFSLPRPELVPDPLVRRSLGYELIAQVVTPIKNIKRRL